MVARFLLITSLLLFLSGGATNLGGLRGQTEGLNSVSKWHTDGSDCFDVRGDVLSCQPPSDSDGHVFNAIWQEGNGMASGSYYWKFEFKLVNRDAIVGVTDLKNLKPDFYTRCLAYGGNLSDCSRLIFANFGPRFESGDRIGMLVEIEGGFMSIYYDYNGQPLGLAFKVPATDLPYPYPFVQFSGPGSVTVTREPVVPQPSPRALPDSVGIEGTWQLVDGDATCSISDVQLNSFSISCRVANIINAAVRRVDGQWQSGPIMTTLMYGEPEKMELEKKLIQVIETLQTIYVADDGKLHMIGKDSQLVFESFRVIPMPYEGSFPTV